MLFECNVCREVLDVALTEHALAIGGTNCRWQDERISSLVLGGLVIVNNVACVYFDHSLVSRRLLFFLVMTQIICNRALEAIISNMRLLQGMQLKQVIRLVCLLHKAIIPIINLHRLLLFLFSTVVLILNDNRRCNWLQLTVLVDALFKGFKSSWLLNNNESSIVLRSSSVIFVNYFQIVQENGWLSCLLQRL